MQKRRLAVIGQAAFCCAEILGRVDGAQYPKSSCPGDAWAVGGDTFETAMGQPCEGHGLDPVGVYAVRRGAADFCVRQQIGQMLHQRGIVRSRECPPIAQA